jgi:hypothetical protein
MGYEIQAEDNFNLIQLNNTFSSIDLIDLIKNLEEGLLETPYLIIQSILEEPCGETMLEQFVDLNNLIQSQKGLMLFVDFDVQDQQQIEKLKLTTIPSFDEAVDYIFMDQLEKELESE